MGVCLGDLDARQVERLRTELAETLAAQFAYPPFFDYAAGHAKVRPVDRGQRDEIARYLSSVNFAELDRVDVRSPELRRYLERLLLRYIEVNPVLARQQFARRLSELRAGVPRAAAQVQRGLVTLTEGGAPAFGARRQPVSWSGQSSSRPALLPEDELEYHTGVLQATLSRAHQAVQAQPAAAGPSRQAPATGTPSAGAPSAGASPYGAFGSAPHATGAPATGGLDYQPTRPIPSVGAPATGVPSAGMPSAGARNGHAAANGPREVPPDLYQLYGDYLTDMHAAVRPGTNAPAPSAPRAPGNGPYATGAPYAAPSAPAPSAPAPSTGGSRQDEMIFAQLRYQVEAYIRRAARNYGLATREGDPARVMDALRVSGQVDEADLRIAEGILALTDRVSRQGHASMEDYRQAFMLYLLYHRGHLGV